MNFEKPQNIKRDSVELAQELLRVVNGLWRELTMKSKPRREFVDAELTKLKNLLNEIRSQFSRGTNNVG